MTDDFFHNRLDQMTDLRHPLAVLANRMPWQEIEASIVQRWLLRMIVKKGLGLLLCLLQASGLDGLFEKLTGGGVEFGDLLWRAGGDELAAVFAGFGAEV